LRRVRELKIYCEIFPSTVSSETLKEKDGKAVILSDGPGHVNFDRLKSFDKSIFENFYILGICYGIQMLAACFGGRVVPGSVRKFGWFSLIKS